MGSRDQKGDKLDKKQYQEALHKLQIELVKLQRTIIADGKRIVIVFEGRDAAGKDGVIKRITKHLSPRETRVVALGKPSDRDQTSWYFQRFVVHLPAAQEMVLFNRSWYNRAGVERVMGFCSEDQLQEFMEEVPYFEQMLVRSGIHLRKYYLDISKDEQERRMDSRRENPLKQWKVSPIDQRATELWAEYSLARDEMFARTHNAVAPWFVVRANDKRSARINVIRHILIDQDYEDKDDNLLIFDPNVVFMFDRRYLENGSIAP